MEPPQAIEGNEEPQTGEEVVAGMVENVPAAGLQAPLLNTTRESMVASKLLVKRERSTLVLTEALQQRGEQSCQKAVLHAGMQELKS